MRGKLIIRDGEERAKFHLGRCTLGSFCSATAGHTAARKQKKANI